MSRIGGGGSVRRVLIVPIVHGEEDLGSLAAAVRERKIRRLGSEGWRRSNEAIDEAWKSVEAFAASLPARIDGWRLYQDGLPVCGREREIVEDLAGRGSRNHRLLLALADRGGVLTGTESPALLLEELERARRGMAASPGAPAEPGPGSPDPLTRRDAFMAKRISETLPEGATGILFVGALHDVARFLPADVAVERPFSAGRGKEG